jgi:hypothetical protein
VHNGSGQIGDNVFAAGRILTGSRTATVGSIQPRTMLCLRHMIGKFIVAHIPVLDRENIVLVRLHKVEERRDMGGKPELQRDDAPEIRHGTH